MEPPYGADPAGGLRVRLRLTPRAARNAVTGVAPDTDGRPLLRVAVTAPPEDGRANAALIRLLAKAWKLPKSDLTIAGGATGRRKTLRIDGDPAGLARRLDDWLRREGFDGRGETD